MEDNPLLVILGATASGKTKLAIELAHDLKGEIISADSRQVFKRMDIGTGKDLQAYFFNGISIPYHLIDILEPGERYNVDAFKNDFYDAFTNINDRQKLPILCGGTGMYMHSLFQNQIYTSVPVNLNLRAGLENFSKEALIQKIETYSNYNNHVDFSSKKRLIRAIEVAEYLLYNQLEIKERPAFKPLVFGLKNEVQDTRKNILLRLELRLKSGMIEEIEKLLVAGVSPDTLIFYGLEYKYIANYLSGSITYKELQEKLGIAICQFAKRQNTFYRKMEKDGVKINWLNAKKSVQDLKYEIFEQITNENFIPIDYGL